MDRRTGDWVLSGLGAVVLVALAVVAGALWYGLRDEESAREEVRAEPTASQPVKTPFGKGGGGAVILDQKAPTATPVPTPIGIPCTSDVLSGQQYGDNAYTGGELELIVNIANTGAQPCDLPVILSVEGVNTDGTSFLSRSVPCNESFCADPLPLPLDPSVQPADFNTRPPKPGTVIVSFSYGSRCYQAKPSPPPCNKEALSTLILRFADDVSVPITFPAPLTVVDGAIGVEIVSLVGKSIWDR